MTPMDDHVLRGRVRLHVRDWAGPTADAPVAVVLHGYTGHARTWDAFAGHLTDRYRVLAPDARGHGESDWDPDGDYAVDTQVADVVAVLDAFGVASATVIGLSMGGRTAFNLAALHPERVERLVIVDIGPQVAAAGAARIGASVGAPDRFATPDEAIAQSRAANPVPPDDVLAHRVRHNLLRLPDGSWTWRWDPALRSPQGSRLPRPDPADQWARLAKIPAPTLLVRGADSDVLDPDDAARMVEVLADAALVEVPGAGHPVPLDRPDAFLEAVRGFLGV